MRSLDALPVDVAVLGSCTSRDNFNSIFNEDYKRFYRCVLTQNQSSIISLMSEPVEIDDSFGEGMSDYDRWIVRTDLDKEFLLRVVELAPRYLILDFFGDVHFGCLRLDDGRYITNNRWKLWQTDFYKELKDADRVTPVRWQDGVEQYVELWKDAFDRLVAYLREHAPDTTPIVHRGFNTGRVRVPDRAEPMRLTKFKKLSKLDVGKANKVWATLDDYAVEAAGCDAIDLTQRGHTSFAEHPWGAFYVHYTMDYYHQFLAELHKIHLRRAADPDVLGMVDDIEAAALERLDLAQQSGQSTIEQQRRRIEEQAAEIQRLRESGMVAAARRTGGRAVRSWRRRAGNDEQRENPA